MSDFYKYFKENMDALNLPAPDALFGSVTTAVSTATTILGTLEKLGRGATMGEIIGATTKLEALSVIASVAAAFYVGAVIGSIAVATGRTISGGTSLSDVLFTAQKYNLKPDWLSHYLSAYPGIYNPSAPGRDGYKHRLAFV
ncbi:MULTISPECIES: hypothetical protein [Pseudomonas]|jgi:hypothetical protein|uniref:Uncharacterized protein n=1 Tax=Pseudomonas syringae pv. primulae TaxID=251707 RepID=A0A0Q0D0N6_9PSED|nr:MULTISPECIES: hypothetical protein [Pseudomonas]KPY32751.1 Uncharacterized protein ALO52_01425 [Pseudomonas syringae pv. primulae]MBD8184996.1 hypothetical protein [Pseudomonas viridiflava]MBD8201692.1 hypothetical protein [Pseudomonas viridiflava]MBP0940212.1 hypothetical protein [Pseudomonas alliivorans]MDY0935018.1 hypothetical protein [Pseudomonas viridiflava]